MTARALLLATVMVLVGMTAADAQRNPCGLSPSDWCPSPQGGLRRAPKLAPDDGTFSSAIQIGVQSKIGS